MKIQEEEKTITAEVGQDSIVTCLKCRNHRYNADETIKWGGHDTAPDPYDYILSGLAACVTITLRQFADRKGWPLEKARVSCRYQTLSTPDSLHREDQIIKEIELVGDLSDIQRKTLLRVAKCPAHRMLERGINIAEIHQ